ncbi:MAG: hypothetical protein WBM83_15160, partial [Flavobacteriaceae bacterium]
RYGHASAVFQDKMWVVGGLSSNGSKNDVWFSEDGVNWQQATANANFSPRFQHTLTVHNNALWLIGGLVDHIPPQGIFPEGDVWRSFNGINWTQIFETAPFGKRMGHATLTFKNKIWVIGGSDWMEDPNSLHKSDVWYSQNGLAWIRQPNGKSPFLGRKNHTVLADGDFMWMVGGAQSGDEADPPHNDILFSDDGIDWYEPVLSNPNFEGRALHSAAIFDEKLIVIGGIDESSPPNLYLKDVWGFEDMPCCLIKQP